MEEFGVYAIFGLNGPPQKLLSADGSRRARVALPPSARQVVMFSRGPWGQRLCVNAELDDAQRMPITIGKLTPYNRCLTWEQWEEETWRDSVTLSISLEGGDVTTSDCSEPEVLLAVKEYTPKDTAAPLGARELSGKRKRGRPAEEESAAAAEMEEEAEEEEEENLCPNGIAGDKTPARKARWQTKSGQKLFHGGGDAAKTKGTDVGPEETQGIVGRTPPQSAARTKGRARAKTPTQAAPPAGPSGRWGQSLCPIDAHTAILIGGQGARMHFCKDPMWKLCTEDMSWVPAETLARGPTPEARIGHTATYDPGSGRIFVFGGSKNRKWFNDVHILDTRSWKWSMVEAQGKVPPLAYHSCSMFRGELFVLGGVFPRPHPEPDGCSDSLYIFDPRLSIWYQPIVTGVKPSPRSGHSACVMQERKIYVFGGWDTPVCYNDMHVLDLGLMEFSAVKTTGDAPSPRSWHGSAVLSDTKFLIHGGYNGNNALSDTFVFDTDTNSWTEVTIPQLSVPRAGHSLVPMDAANRLRLSEGDHDDHDAAAAAASGFAGGALLVFGGGDNEGHFYSDVTTVAVQELLGGV